MNHILLFVLSLLFSNGIAAQSTLNIDSTVTEIQPYELRVFPNPTTDSFAVVDNYLVDEIVLYNIIGRKVTSFEHVTGKKYSLIDLPDGMYFVSLVSHNDGVLKTLRISKRVMRP